MSRFQRIINSNIFIIVSVCLSRIMLDYLYANEISPIYAYRGLTYSYSVERLFLSWIVLVAFIGLILYLVNRDNDETEKGAIIINVLLCCSAVPTTTIIAYLDLNIEFSILLAMYWTLVVFLYGRKRRRKFVISAVSFKQTKPLLYAITVFFAINLLIIIFRYTRISFNLNLIDVYEVRSAFKKESIPTVLRYLFYGSTMVFPIIIVYGLETKEISLVITSSVCQLLAFFADGRKATLFMLILTILGYFFIRNFNIKLIPFGTFGVILIGCLEKWILHTSFFTNYIVRRLFVLPSYLQYAYYDFFLNNEKDFLRQSILGRIGIKSPYSNSLPELIGIHYYGGSYANNGLFADSFANFGIAGVVLYPFLIVGTLHFLDRCANKVSIEMSMGIIFCMSYAFLSSSFFTVMLTHGFIACCLIVALMPTVYSRRRKEL